MHAGMAGMLVLIALAALAGCGEGDFDQRVRGDIDQLRAEAFTDINSNPRADPRVKPDPITGEVSTGGFVTLGRVLLHPIADDGVADLSDGAILGNSISRVAFEAGVVGPARTRFTATVTRPYSGAVLVRVLPYVSASEVASYANPASGMTNPRLEMMAGDELVGFVPDYPNRSDAVVISPLTTLAVERARWLGGLSGGNMSLASLQVGQFFGADHTRATGVSNLLTNAGRTPLAEAADLAMGAISQLAVMAGTTPLAVTRALQRDIRDDGELNGSIGVIPGTAFLLPDLGAPGMLGGLLLRNGYLQQGNTENVGPHRAFDTEPGRRLAALVDYLDTTRRLADFTPELEEVSQEFKSLSLRPGQFARLGLRGFTTVQGQLYLVMSSDGPTVAIRDVASSSTAAVLVEPDGRIRANPLATAGASSLVAVRVRPDGVFLTGGYDWTFTINVAVVE